MILKYTHEVNYRPPYVEISLPERIIIIERIDKFSDIIDIDSGCKDPCTSLKVCCIDPCTTLKVCKSLFIIKSII